MNSPVGDMRWGKAEWETHKDDLIRMYLAQRYTVRQIVAKLHDNGYTVKEKALKDRFAKWDIRKNRRAGVILEGIGTDTYSNSALDNDASSETSQTRSHASTCPSSRPLGNNCIDSQPTGTTADDEALEAAESQPHQNDLALVHHQGFSNHTQIGQSDLYDSIAECIPRHPAIADQDRLGRHTLHEIYNWCVDYRSRRGPDASTDTRPSLIYPLLDDCKLAVAAASEFNTKASWKILMDVDQRARPSWIIVRPECFMQALYGILRLNEARGARIRTRAIGVVSHRLTKSASETLGARNPMTLLLQMAAKAQLTSQLCFRVFEVVTNGHIAHAKGPSGAYARAKHYRAFGDILTNLQLFQKAEVCFQKALEYAIDAHDDLGIAGIYRGLARLKRYQCKPLQEACDLLHEGYKNLQRAKKECSRVGVKILFESAFVRMKLGQLDTSEKLYRTAIVFWMRNGTTGTDVSDGIALVRGLNEVLEMQGKRQEAEELRNRYLYAFEQR